MSFLSKIFHKKDDFDINDPAFTAGLPPMQDAMNSTMDVGASALPNASSPDSSHATSTPANSTSFEQSGTPSSGVASFMERSGDDLTGLPPFEDDAPEQQHQPTASQQLSSQQTTPSPAASSSTKGQELAQHYIQQQEQPIRGQQTTSQGKTTAHSLEVIDVKLDAIRSELSSISQRLEKLEQKKW
ncbi:hypothetical protein K9M74_01855 [Candidatus Woesearchaeota archaeon]|nr:hypothetical protein [Candidatus Woesearchaeota archaeon]